MQHRLHRKSSSIGLDEMVSNTRGDPSLVRAVGAADILCGFGSFGEVFRSSEGGDETYAMRAPGVSSDVGRASARDVFVRNDVRGPRVLSE